MKILEINKFYFANGGADRHFLDLVGLLEANGNEVAVFAMRHPRNLESKWSRYFLSTVGYTAEYSLWQKIKGVFRMYYSFEAKRKINKLLDDFQPDVVHIHNIYHQISPAILPEIKKRGIPVMMTAHDFKLICPDYLLNGEDYGFWKFVAKECFKKSYLKSFLVALEFNFHKLLDIYGKNIDLYIAPSVFVQNKLASHGISKEKIRVLPHFFCNALKTSLLGSMEINNNIVERGYGVAGEMERYALYAGRISKDKGVEELLDIFEKVNGMKLYLAGKIEDGFKIKEMENIKYLGQLDQEKLGQAMDGAEIVVSGTRLPETFGLIALEAASHGKPFVGFNTGAYSEIITNGKNGMLVRSRGEFKSVVDRIIDGKVAFDRNEILKHAEKYEKQRYYEDFIRMSRNIQNCAKH